MVDSQDGMNNKVSLIVALAIGLAFCSVACKVKEQDIKVESITISQPSAEMIVGESVQLKASITPSNAIDNVVFWASSKQSVAIVSDNGLVTAISEGETTITATAGGKRDQCTITVKDPNKLQVNCVTTEARNIETCSAELCGNTVIKNAHDAKGQAFFCYSKELTGAADLEKSGTKLEAGVISNEGGAFSAVLDGLTPGTTYFYMASITIDGLSFSGDVNEFTTSQITASVTTLDAKDVSETTAIIGGELDIVSKGEFAISASVYYSTDGTSVEAIKRSGTRVPIDEIDEEGHFYKEVTGLNESVKYYYIAIVAINDIVFEGSIKSFTTKDKTLAISITGGNDNVGESSAKLYGWCNQEEPEVGSVAYGIEYSATDLTSSALTVTAIDKDSENKYCCLATGLSSNTLYYYRAFTLCNGIRNYGEVKTFTTLSINASVSTLEATEITESKATLNGFLSVESIDDLEKEVWFLYGSTSTTVEALKTGGKRLDASLLDDGSFKASLFPPCNTAFYYVAVSRVHDMECYGEVKYFKTDDIVATITTMEASNITEFRATINGKLSDVSNDSLSKVVFLLYSETATSLDDLIKNGNKVVCSLSEDGTFSRSLSTLKYNTKYYYVAAAQLISDYYSRKDFYGEVKTFNTLSFSETVNVTTLGASDISDSQVTLHGKVTINSDEDLKIFGVAFRYSNYATSAEDLKEGFSQVATLSEDGSFSTVLTNISENTIFYVAEVTVIGRDSYNSYLELVYGDMKVATNTGEYCVIDHKAIVVESAETSATFNIVASTSWSFTYQGGSSNVKITPSTGFGNAAVTITFPANQTANNIFYCFTLKSDQANVNESITVTQKRDSNEMIVALTFPDDNCANNRNGAYEGDWVAKKGSYSWNVKNFNNNSWNANWTYIKTGWKTKAITSTIVTDSALSDIVASVTVSFDKFDSSVVTSTALYVALDKDFTKDVIKIPGTEVEAGDYTYFITTPVSNAYYKLEVVCAKASANGGIQISQVSYYR